jgi:hypothetical protein
MRFEFEQELIYWRGPAPWFFVPMPPEHSDAIRERANELTYGWGVIPVCVTIGETYFETSLFPKDGVYLVPVKAAVRKAEALDEGDVVAVRLEAGTSDD